MSKRNEYYNVAMELLKHLDKYGENRIVGGAVRDYVADRDLKDIDIATTMTPDEVVKFANENSLRSIPTGIEHGTVTIIFQNYHFEITTLRRDVSTDGRRATVAFTKDFRVDAERRDFTFNALSMDRNQTLYDYFGGSDDLLAGRVRYIGDPRARISEDYLRILRYFRFHTYYGKYDTMDTESLTASVEMADGLKQISAERKWSELTKIINHYRGSQTLEMMSKNGVLYHLIGDHDIRYISGLLDSHPLLKIAAIKVFNVKAADWLKSHLKLSNEEHKFLVEVVKGADGKFDKEHLYRVKRDMFMHQLHLAVAQGRVDARTFHDARELAKAWTIPTFPLQASDFMFAGIPEGKLLGQALRISERTWIDSDFTVDRMELITSTVEEIYGTN